MAESHLPPGFRFHPTDEELLVHYLKRKAAGIYVDDWIIGDIDIYNYEPAELPGMAVLRSRDSEWFFFNSQDKKQLYGSRTNRTTRAGYWKATGKDRRIAVGSCVGLKKTLIYYCGRAPHGERTDWVMHEYRLDDGTKKKNSSNGSVVLCRVRRKSGLGPRNGEQYGAPVLGEEEEEVSNLANNTHIASSMSGKPMVGLHIQQASPIATVLEDSRTSKEAVDAFLQDFLSLEDLQENHDPREDVVVEELLSLLKDQSYGVLVPTATVKPVDMETCNIDNCSNLVDGAENDPLALEDMLQHIVGDRPEMTAEQLPGLHESSPNPQTHHLQRIGFLELADLDEPCHSQSSLGSAALDDLLLELGAGMEFSISTGLAQDVLHLQQNLKHFDHREDIRGSLRVGGSGMNNESEVRLDSSQSLSVLGSVQTRLSILEDESVRSGLVSCSGQERGLALSHSQGIRVHEQAETGHKKVDKWVENGASLLESVQSVEPVVDRFERHVDNTSKADEGRSSEPDTLADDYNRSFSPTPRDPAHHQPSPSRIAMIISHFLGKMNALPASAEELPLEWGWSLLEKDISLFHVTESKTPHLVQMDPAPVNIFESSLNLKAEVLSPSQHEKQISRRVPNLSVSSMAILGGSCRSLVKSFVNGASMFLFCITTLALVVFCMFRGFCRSTRVAFV